MNESIMSYELQAMERQNMRNEISILKSQIATMESDFARCAKGISPCFFCSNDDNCAGTSETCIFKWKNHN